MTAAAAITAVSTNTPVNEPAVVVNAVNTIPVAASARAPPRESEMDIAELLKPSVSGVERASVITLSRGYMSPMPPPARTQPAIATAAGQPSTVVTSARAIASSTITEPIRTATGLPSRPPRRLWTPDAAAQARAPPVRVRPANVGEKA